MLNLKTEMCSTLNIEYPIIQAGMAGGATTPELIANVSNAGGPWHVRCCLYETRRY